MPKTFFIGLVLCLILSPSASNAQGQYSFPLRHRLCPGSTTTDYTLNQLSQAGQMMGYLIDIPQTGQVALDYAIQTSPSQTAAYSQACSQIDEQKHLLLTSAGFNTESHGFPGPVGFSASNGTIHNRVVAPNMDGLAVIANGKLRVYNKEEIMDLPGIGRGSITEYSYKASFSGWVQSTRADVLQVQLLAHEGELLVPPAAKLRMATRKILAEVVDATGEIHLMIYYLNQRMYLYDAALLAYNHLQRQNYTVNYMINLDTGAHDVLQLKAGAEYCFGDKVSGFSPPRSSNNLLLFYRP